MNDLSLHIHPGEIYGFIGHNGAGKTTTLKSCCGILQYDSGEIYVDGQSVACQGQSREAVRSTLDTSTMYLVLIVTIFALFGGYVLLNILTGNRNKDKRTVNNRRI